MHKISTSLKRGRRRMLALAGMAFLPTLGRAQNAANATPQASAAASSVVAPASATAPVNPPAPVNTTPMNTANTAPSAAGGRKAEWATPVSAEHNLFRVTPGFFRSARLKRADVPLLQQLGIKTVVSLRAFHSDEEVLEHSNIRMQRIPMLTWSIGDKEVITALRAIRQAEKEGAVLLHCQHGADRTGLVAAIYRMVVMGWSRSQALDELQNGGYGYHSMWKNIIKYLHNVDLEKIRQGLVQ